TRRSGRNMISLEPIGIGQAVSSRHRSGKDSNPAADFINGVATAAVSSSSSAAPGSAISSRHFSVEDEVDPHSAGLAGALRQPNAAPMWKRILWSREKQRCTVL